MNKERFIELLTFLLLFCLGLLGFQEIFSAPIFGFDIQNYSIFAQFIQNIQNIQYVIVVFIIVVGSLLFYGNRDKIENIEEEQEKELEEEEKRKAEFGGKFPMISRIPVFGWIVKWMYGEGWRYSLGLVGVIILGFILKYYVSINLSPENDETYTYMVIEGFNEFGKIGITPSGEMYYYSHKIFHYLTTIFYNFFYDNGFQKLFALRSFNIFLGTILMFPLYFFIKKITSRKISLLSIFLISINWYLLITFVTARPYVLFSIFSVIMTILLILGFNELFRKKVVTKKSIYYIIFGIILGLINFYEGHILGLYHNIFLIGILLFFTLFKLRLKTSLKIIGFGFILVSIFFLYLYFFKSNFFEFIINNYNPRWQYNYLSIAFNQFSYLTELGLVIIGLLFCFIFTYKNNEYKILTIYIIFGGIIFHGYLFGPRLNNFKYLVDYLIILLILLSIFIVLNKNNKLIIGLVLLFLGTNIFGIYKIYNDEITWIVLKNENSITDYKLCKNNKLIFTDSPGRAFLLFGNNKTIYSLLSFNDIYHINNTKFKYLNIYTLQNKDQLKELIKEYGDGCFVFSHNMYNSTGRFGNEELFNFVINHGIIINEKYYFNRPFGTGKYPFSNNRNGTILIVNQSSFNN